MPRLAIVQDTFAATVLTTFGLVVLAMIAVVSVGLWVVVARGRARREIKAFDDPTDDPVGALRQEDLVVQDTPSPKDTVVAQLVRTPQTPPNA
ncbi:MAG TPA: hypothetical protein VHW60_22650 [Caulobacteraceae bacterium]|jgi:hypothetical protein|nr:hypothetical protein [Caulobacteraceae bacterium]